MMKNPLFQQFCLTINRVVPSKIISSLYYPSFLVFESLCKIHFSSNLNKAYLRNSFYLNYCVFGLSDYDFGIVLNKRISNQDWNSFYGHYRLLKKIFPFWSEINLYVLDEMPDISPFINPIEAKRDPFLQQHQFANPTIEEKFTFLSRCLFVNLGNWSYESKKKNKWATYFKLAETEFDAKDNLQTILSVRMKSLYQTEIQKNYPKFILSFHSLYQSSRDILWEEVNPEVKVLLPQYYLWFERENEEDLFIQNLSQSDRDMIVSQLKWEVWGLTTQIYQFQKNKSFPIHLNRVRKVFKLLKIPQEEIDSLDLILRVFNNLNNSELS